jgi:hypothetical protein
MATKGAALWVPYVCLDTNSRPLAGDLANHTITWTKDGTTATATNNQGGAGAHIQIANGNYAILITATEANCASGMVGGSSATSGALIVPKPVMFDDLAGLIAVVEVVP